MLRFSMKFDPRSVVKTTVGYSHYVGLERSRGQWWLVATDGHALVRLPGEEIKTATPDVAGDLGEPFLRVLRLLLSGEKTFSIQADSSSVEVYNEIDTVIARVPRPTEPNRMSTQSATIQRDPWAFEQVLGLNPKKLAAAAKAMGSPERLFVHMTPSKEGVCNEMTRISTEPFAPDSTPHGFFMPIAVPASDVRRALSDLSKTSEVAAAGVRAMHPWCVEPVKPVAPVKVKAGAT